MGSVLCKRWIGVEEARILLLGLDAAGKTTVLYKLKLGEVVTTIPTIGFNVEKLRFKNVLFSAWDIGGRDKMRPLVRHYFANTDAIVYIVDSNDVERMAEAKEELLSMLKEDDLRESVLLVLANKQDLPNARSVVQISELFQLHTVKQNYHIIPTVAPSGEGLSEAMEWLHQAILQKRGIIKDFLSKDGDREAESRIAKTNETKTIDSVQNHWNKAWELFRTMFFAN